MGSTFVKSNRTITHAFGRQEDLPVYIQFVPGVVVEVATSKESLRAGVNDARENINTIIAKPHVYEGKVPRKNKLGEKYRYKPLLRGMFEVPAKGDPVLLCTIGRKNYYLGPLNTANNVNHNSDNLFIPEWAFIPKKVKGPAGDLDSATGESTNFRKTDHNRLEKKYIDELDSPVLSPDGQITGSQSAYREVHGDMIFEGRHGNSVRIGSRNINPYIYISNGRSEQSSTEGARDGSLISITSTGTLGQHVGQYISDETMIPPGSNGWDFEPSPDYISIPPPPNAFRLSNDMMEISSRTTSNLVGFINKTDDIGSIMYNYRDNQILFHSDRITINSKSDDIYLSSFRDIHIGAGRSLGISTHQDIIIESRKTYLGKNAVENGEPMVLGNKLIEILQEILSILKDAGSNQYFPLPLGILPTALEGAGGPLSARIIPVEQKLERLLSQHYFIEPNR